MNRSFNNKQSVYTPIDEGATVYTPVLPKADVNYTHDLSYMKGNIKKRNIRKGRKLGIGFGIAVGLLVTLVIFLMHRSFYQQKIDAYATENSIIISCAVEKHSYADTQQKDDAHELLAKALDDGDCTTPVICPCCDAVLVEANSAHTPREDDGNCTTAIRCKDCTVILTPANKSHTPEIDDGDCTTAVKCSLCNVITTPAKTHKVQDDGDCTTGGAFCTNTGCEYERPVMSQHAPQPDDGDCTTPTKCSHPYCNQTVIPAPRTEHLPMADDGNCTTAIKCEFCNVITTPARDSHTPEEDDGFYTTDILCAHCGTLLIPAPITVTEYLIDLAYMAGFGIAAALVILLIFLGFATAIGNSRAKRYEEFKKRQEVYNFKLFNPVRINLSAKRKTLICESMATVNDENSSDYLGIDKVREGRIFLTEQALEFYDTDFTTTYKNFVLPLNTILSLDIDGTMQNNKITVRSNVGRYDFTVPDGSADKWRSQILNARDYFERIPSTNNKFDEGAR